MEEAGHASGRLAHDGDVAGVATEPGDVVLDPLEGQHLVVHALEKKDCHCCKRQLSLVKKHQLKQNSNDL